MSRARYIAYIGNWGVKPLPEGYGITACRYDAKDGSLSPEGVYLKDVHVGNVYLDETAKLLYCVDEKKQNEDFYDLGGGSKAFSAKIENDGKLVELNSVYSYAPLPSFIRIDSKHKYVLLTNHSGGDPITVAEKDEKGIYQPVLYFSDASLVLYHLMPDGSIGNAIDIYKAKGHGVMPKQAMPHLHSINEFVKKNIFIVCDKGCNKVYSFKIENGKLHKCFEYADKEDSAPRYGQIIEDEDLFVFNHEGNQMVTFLHVADDGKLKFADSIDVLPGIETTLKKESSDIKLSPDGKTIYNIVRGVNDINVIQKNESTQKYEMKQIVHFEATTFPGGGARGCAVSPDGKYLYICVSDDGDIHRFAINDHGMLEGDDVIQHFGHPSNITFLAANF